ncbi:MAG: hypothetical protein M1840_007872 [Geoglossum simile]|nr:MAG: hypothetical protein M1840_007872 [Geoglossum simile]
MSAPTIQIPKRFSSIAAVEEHRLEIRTSRQDFEKGSTKHIKLRIEDVELEQQELELDKVQLDLEANQSLIDRKSHRNACRSMRKRNFSLGDELWELRRQLRAHDESIGVVAALIPDSEGAFVSALLHLYKDPRISKKRSSTMQSDLRANSIIA